MYYVLLYDVGDNFLERRAAFRDAHLKLVREAHDRGELLVGGRLRRSGGWGSPGVRHGGSHRPRALRLRTTRMWPRVWGKGLEGPEMERGHRRQVTPPVSGAQDTADGRVARRSNNVPSLQVVTNGPQCHPDA